MIVKNRKLKIVFVANASDERYNRTLTTEEFEAVWKTGLIPDNIYIITARDTSSARGNER